MKKFFIICSIILSSLVIANNNSSVSAADESSNNCCHIRDTYRYGNDNIGVAIPHVTDKNEREYTFPTSRDIFSISPYLDNNNKQLCLMLNLNAYLKQNDKCGGEPDDSSCKNHNNKSDDLNLIFKHVENKNIDENSGVFVAFYEEKQSFNIGDHDQFDLIYKTELKVCRKNSDSVFLFNTITDPDIINKFKNKTFNIMFFKSDNIANSLKCGDMSNANILTDLLGIWHAGTHDPSFEFIYI